MFGGNAFLDYIDANTNGSLDAGDSPRTYAELLADPYLSNNPLDLLDFAFYRHDVFRHCWQ